MDVKVLAHFTTKNRVFVRNNRAILRAKKRLYKIWYSVFFEKILSEIFRIFSIDKIQFYRDL